MQFLDLKTGVAETCAQAFRKYLQACREAGCKVENKMPSPEFFIGAHAEVLGLPLATADAARYRTYFPTIRLNSPQ